MSIQIENLPKKKSDHNTIDSMPPFGVNYPTWWNSNDPQLSSFSKNLSLKPQFSLEDSSPTQSSCQSHHDVTASEGTNSQDQCAPMQQGQDESPNRIEGGFLKPTLSLGNSNYLVHPSQVDYNHTTSRIPYPYSDPCYGGGIVTVYGSHAAVIHPQIVGITPARVPLPLDIAEDEPIFVNAKQYHGILRRRQSRAKLEAQNKLIKARKPYLHESRHRHALNRVRGSGGRFLSKKKLQQPDPSPTTTINMSLPASKIGGSVTSCSDSGADVIFWQLDRWVPGISAHVAGAVNLHRDASAVR